MKDQKFPFTRPGVQTWITQLYSSSDATIRAEQNLIAQDTASWIPRRFDLDASQIDYMHSLGTVSLDQIGRDINEAISNRADITLRRDEPPTATAPTDTARSTPPQNSKVADSAKKYSPTSTARGANLDKDQDSLISLDFHFYYISSNE